MPGAQKNVFDAAVRNRIAVLRFARGVQRDLADELARADAEAIAEVRRRVPNLARGNLRGPRAKLLFEAVRDVRAEAIRGVRDELKARMLAFAKVEAELIGKAMTRVTGVAFDGASADAIRRAVFAPFATGEGSLQTINQVFDQIARGDRNRVLSVLQHGIAGGEDLDLIARRLAGRRSARFADGALAVTRRNVEAAIATAVNHAANAAVVAWGEANADVVIGFEWSAILDAHTCSRCRRQNGRFVPLGDIDRPPPGMQRAQYKGPPIHFRDRCVLVPIFNLRRLAARMPG